MAYGRILAAHGRLALAILLAVSLLGGAYAIVAAPSYESSVLFQVEEPNGPDDSSSFLGTLASSFQVKTSVNAELVLLGSRHLLLAVIDELGLCVDVAPSHVPVVGQALARLDPSGRLPRSWLPVRYAWAGEQLAVTRFEVPAAAMERRFTVTAGAAGHYTLEQPVPYQRWEGTAGSTLDVALDDGRLRLDIATLEAHPGARFTLRRLPAESVLAGLQGQLHAVELGTQTGVIRLALQGQSASQVYRTLSAVAREYLRQHRARKTEEAERALALAQLQLPELRARLEQAEAAYSQFRSRNGTLSAGASSQALLVQVAQLREHRGQLLRDDAQLALRFSSEHGNRIALARQVRLYDGELAALARQLATMPQLEQTLGRLQRDVQMHQHLYDGLQGAAQQLRLIAVGKNDSVRLIDAAQVPERPVRPAWLVALMAVVLGLLMGVMASIIQHGMTARLDDLSAFHGRCAAGGCATIAHSPGLAWQRGSADADADANQAAPPLLALTAPADPAVDSMRVFLAMLGHALQHAAGNVVVFAGATAQLGTSALVANLAVLLAQSRRRVLLIDADLRAGSLERYFATPAQPGLVQLITGSASLGQVLRRQLAGGLDFIPCGERSNRPAELLLDPRLAATLAALAPQYDVILVDAAPLSGLADALALVRHAGLFYLVARAGASRAADVETAFNVLQWSGLQVDGMLLNDAA